MKKTILIVLGIIVVAVVAFLVINYAGKESGPIGGLGNNNNQTAVESLLDWMKGGTFSCEFKSINTHDGETNRETRLILVVDRSINMPLYFRYNAGNIVDVTTLKATIDEFTMNGVNTDFAIVDAGYYSEKNIKALYGDHIAFL